MGKRLVQLMVRLLPGAEDNERPCLQQHETPTKHDAMSTKMHQQIYQIYANKR